MIGLVSICAGIWWIIAIINIVFCILTGKRYKKLGQKGTVKKIILSWVICIGSILIASIIVAAVNPYAPAAKIILLYGIAVPGAVIAVIYTARAANRAKKDIAAKAGSKTGSDI